MPKTGDLFGQWTVLSVEPVGPKHRRALCRCDCGSERLVVVFTLKNGRSSSCGCTQAAKSAAANSKHGLSGAREYSIWENMKARCQNEKHTHYPYYGGRGIVVCERWQQFEAFIADMGSAPSTKHTLDRIDNNRGYEPSNCRWATRRDQSNNTRFNRHIEVDGTTKTISQWSAVSGVKHATIWSRLSRGWSSRDAVFGRRHSRLEGQVTT